jgi:hypothetical protein
MCAECAPTINALRNYSREIITIKRNSDRGKFPFSEIEDPATKHAHRANHTTANTRKLDEDQMDGLSDAPPKQEYTLTGVLDFLQKSWIQFELERARWNVERSELLVRTFFIFH